MYISTGFRETAMKVNNRYYLQSIMRDMGYNVIECNDKATKDFRIGKYDSTASDREIIDKYFNHDQVEDKARQAIQRKLKLLTICTCGNSSMITPMIRSSITIYEIPMKRPPIV
jgi:hypothetical protein